MDSGGGGHLRFEIGAVELAARSFKGINERDPPRLTDQTLPTTSFERVPYGSCERRREQLLQPREHRLQTDGFGLD
jgi:hypothetical protein